MGRFEWIELTEANEPIQIEKPIVYDEDYYLKQADKSFEKGSYQAALRYYSRALNLNNTLKQAWLGQVLCLIALGQFNEAIVWSDKALEFCPDHPEIIAAKALALNRLGLKEEALSFSDKAIKTSKISWLVWAARADILLDENENAANYCFYKAQEFAKENWFFYMMMGISFLSAKEISKATYYFNKAVDLKKDNAILYYHLANAYYEDSNYSLAKACLKKAIEIKPDFQEAAVMLRKISKLTILNILISFFKKLLFSAKGRC